MSGRLKADLIDFPVFFPRLSTFVAHCRGRFWCETGAANGGSFLKNGMRQFESCHPGDAAQIAPVSTWIPC
jgi:hypothetical protein